MKERRSITLVSAGCKGMGLGNWGEDGVVGMDEGESWGDNWV